MSFSLKCCLGAVLLSICVAYGQSSSTVSQGVYTDDQAKRGQAVYKERCASCHGDTLAGRIGPPLAGDDFLADWNKQPLSELFGKIKNTMPQDAPRKTDGTANIGHPGLHAPDRKVPFRADGTSSR